MDTIEKTLAGYPGKIVLIVAHGRNGEIGKGKDMPWGRSFPSDLKWFNRVTTSFGAAVLVVGKTTYDTLPQKVINDPTRTFAILTSKVREVTPTGNNYYVPNVTELCNYFGERDFIIIGGGKVYDLFYPRADMVFTTLIHSNFSYVHCFVYYDHPGRYGESTTG